MVLLSHLTGRVGNAVSEVWSWWWDANNPKDQVARLIFTVLVPVLVISWYKWVSRKYSLRLPPGPWDLPLVGHLPFLEPDLHQYFRKLAQVYGPIFKFRMGKKLCVVLSSPLLAKEVLRQHDTIFANHEAPISGLATSYGGLDMVWSPYGPRWAMIRKVFVGKMLTKANLDSCYALRQRELRQTLKYMYSKGGTPFNVGQQMFVTVLNTVLSMLWGSTLQGNERVNFGVEFREMAGEILMLLGKPNVSDLFPALARFDLQGIEKRSKELMAWFDRLFDTVIDKRAKMENVNRGSKDFMQVSMELIDQKDPDIPFTIVNLRALFIDIIVGGTDTTSTTLEWAISETMNNPEIMRKVQDELELVVGLNNMVEESHVPKLGYLDAVVKETQRLHVALPLLVPHVPSSSCTVGGYHIPKGAHVFVNVWAMHRDPEAWENPLEFRPERFLNDGGKSDYRGNNFSYLPFGSGRRSCAGIPLAERMLMCTLASFLHSFEWRLPEGTKMDLSEKFGLSLKRTTPLVAIAAPRLLNHEVYNGHGRGRDMRVEQFQSGGGRDRATTKDKIDSLGRLMTRILRHMASELSLDIRSDGYVRVQDLLKLNLKTFANISMRSHTVDDVMEAVRKDNKQRFGLLEENGELFIRANQGHTIVTIESESLLKPILSAEEAPVCVHGTYKKNLEAIVQSGLKRMKRLHVHFARGLPTDGDVISGMRRDVNVLIFLDVRKALEEGMKLYISENNVILTEGIDGVVPAKYFVKIETWPGRQSIPF
ncbi:hypothetical protein GIB67_013000 [Kingdonia uniflora]|uniref:2'-phosphotransferase n=1 Tax=Kingdonia uniflora TaxID=39325 RepID=A0A7J7MCD3_9MAGN|nr:hypothetical protein GIB67_013000 [Kingdonia uniflora]